PDGRPGPGEEGAGRGRQIPEDLQRPSAGAAVKAVRSMTLGVMTAIGGFVDIGNLVTSGITGARFGMTLTWAVLVGTIGMALFAEMAGRVTAVTRKPIFHVVRERLGVRVSLVSTAASPLLNVRPLAAELGGGCAGVELAQLWSS